MIHTLFRCIAGVVPLVLLVLVGACSDAQSPSPPQAWLPGNGQAEFKPFTFVHLGDPQIGFGRDGAENDHSRLVQIGKQINAAKPDFVFLAGDLTHKNLPQEEELLEAGLKTFEPPLVAAPGNHDAMTHQALAKFRKRWGKDYHVFTHNGCDFIVVNSLLLSEQGTWFEQKDDPFPQEIETQWKWLEAALAQSAKAGRAHVFLFMHVAPFLKLEQDPDGYENLPSVARSRLMDLARKHNVRAILCGHNHANLEVRSASGPTLWTAGGTASVGEGEKFGFHVWHVEQDKAWREFVEMTPVALNAGKSSAAFAGSK
jgi:3',5'-cyclic AMP phosphodiesterase CpdA